MIRGQRCERCRPWRRAGRNASTLRQPAHNRPPDASSRPLQSGNPQHLAGTVSGPRSIRLFQCEAEWRAADSAISWRLGTDQCCWKPHSDPIRSGGQRSGHSQGLGETPQSWQTGARQKGANSGGLVEPLPVEPGLTFTVTAGGRPVLRRRAPLELKALNTCSALGTSGTRRYDVFIPSAHDRRLEDSVRDTDALLVDHLARYPLPTIHRYAQYEPVVLKRPPELRDHGGGARPLLRRSGLYQVAVSIRAHGRLFAKTSKDYWGKYDVTNAAMYRRVRALGKRASKA